MKCEDREKGIKAVPVPMWVSEVANWAKNHRALAVGLGAAMMLMLVVSVSPRRQSSSPPEFLVPEPCERAAGGRKGGRRAAAASGGPGGNRTRDGMGEKQIGGGRRRVVDRDGPSANGFGSAGGIRGDGRIRTTSGSGSDLAAFTGHRMPDWLEELRERLDGLEREDERN